MHVRKSLLTAVSALALSLGSTAALADNEAYVEQDGGNAGGNTVQINQADNTNSSRVGEDGDPVRQNGDNNLMQVDQHDVNNMVDDAVQIGSNNVLKIDQWNGDGESPAARNVVTDVRQDGSGNVTDIKQDGYRNEVNEVTQDGNGNTVEIAQDGDLQGNANRGAPTAADQTATPDWFQSSPVLGNAGGSSSYINQTGDGNVAEVDQNAGSRNGFAISQDGADSIEAFQSGSRNFVAASQQVGANHAEVSQSGANNVTLISQGAGGNYESPGPSGMTDDPTSLD